jgi:hypothetical protein
MRAWRGDRGQRDRTRARMHMRAHTSARVHTLSHAHMHAHVRTHAGTRATTHGFALVRQTTTLRKSSGGRRFQVFSSSARIARALRSSSSMACRPIPRLDGSLHWYSAARCMLPCDKFTLHAVSGARHDAAAGYTAAYCYSVPALLSLAHAHLCRVTAGQGHCCAPSVEGLLCTSKSLPRRPCLLWTAACGQHPPSYAEWS